MLLEEEGAKLFVIYHSCVLFDIGTGVSNSEFIPKSFSVEGDHSL